MGIRNHTSMIMSVVIRRDSHGPVNIIRRATGHRFVRGGRYWETAYGVGEMG